MIWAKEVCNLERTQLKETNVEVVDLENDCYIYQIALNCNDPVVKLNYLLKK